MASSHSKKCVVVRTAVALAAVIILTGIIIAQAPKENLPAPRTVGQSCDPGTLSGFPPILPMVPEKDPRTDIASFIDNLGTNDGTFEVVVGQGRLLTLKKDLAVPGKARPLIAVGDPAVVDFVMVGPRQIRIIGLRIGRTDMSITTADNQVYGFEVQVVADLNVLRAQLKAVFPNASLKLSQVRDHIVAEGQARDTAEVNRIIDTIKAYLVSVQASQIRHSAGAGAAPAAAKAAPREAEVVPAPGAPGRVEWVPPVQQVQPEQGVIVADVGAQAEPRVINLIRVIGPQQVLLKVCVAELDRTSLREIGADLLGGDRGNRSIFGTQIGGGAVGASGTLSGAGLTATSTLSTNNTSAIFGIFEGANFAFLMRALRQNSVLKILAEPNLVTLHGQPASFLAGGEFPIPVPQVSSGGFASTITIQFKEFGVRLNFVPFIMDGDMIRLSVDPEVSTIDFALGTTLVPGGSPVPGLNTRKSHATVELREGQTLAIAGLLQVALNGTTSRIPILGDLPVIGSLFSGNTNQRQEKELVVTVTPYLVQPMCPEQVPPLPGDDVGTPGDLEFYLLRRLETRNAKDHRTTLGWDDPLCLRKFLLLEKKHLHGRCGFSE